MILFDEEGDGGGPAYKVFVRTTDGTPAVQIGEGYGLRLSWSGRWAITRPVGSDSQFVIQPIGPGDARTLDFGGRSRLAWSPDDRRLLVTSVQTSGASRVFVHDLETGQTEPLTPEGFAGLRVSPDGESAFVTNGRGELLSWPLAGGEPQPLPWFQPSDILVGLTRDGRTAFVATTRPEDQLPRKVYQVDTGTGERRLWRAFGSADPSGGRDIAVPLVSANGGAYAYRYRERFSGSMRRPARMTVLCASAGVHQRPCWWKSGSFPKLTGRTRWTPNSGRSGQGRSRTRWIGRRSPIRGKARPAPPAPARCGPDARGAPPAAHALRPGGAGVHAPPREPGARAARAGAQARPRPFALPSGRESPTLLSMMAL